MRAVYCSTCLERLLSFGGELADDVAAAVQSDADAREILLLPMHLAVIGLGNAAAVALLQAALCRQLPPSPLPATAQAAEVQAARAACQRRILVDELLVGAMLSRCGLSAHGAAQVDESRWRLTAAAAAAMADDPSRHLEFAIGSAQLTARGSILGALSAGGVEADVAAEVIGAPPSPRFVILMAIRGVCGAPG